jgi:hypothetical protein
MLVLDRLARALAEPGGSRRMSVAVEDADHAGADGLSRRELTVLPLRFWGLWPV